jgi:hypothetical protein
MQTHFVMKFTELDRLFGMTQAPLHTISIVSTNHDFPNDSNLLSSSQEPLKCITNFWVKMLNFGATELCKK